MAAEASAGHFPGYLFEPKASQEQKGLIIYIHVGCCPCSGFSTSGYPLKIDADNGESLIVDKVIKSRIEFEEIATWLENHMKGV